MYIDDLTVPMGQECECSLAGSSCSGSLTGCNQGVGQGFPHSRFRWESIHSQAQSVVIGRTQVLLGYWIEGLSSLLAIGQRRSSVSCDMSLSIGQLLTWELASFEWAREKGGITDFIKIMSEGISHHSCHILFIRSESLGQAHTQGEGITWRPRHLEVVITGNLEGWLPHCPSGESNPPPSIKAHMILVRSLSIIPAIPTPPHTGITWDPGHQSSQHIQLATVIGPRSSHVTQAGPIRVFPWDLYILKQGDRSSLFHLKSLTWNDVAWGFLWPYPLPTIKKNSSSTRNNWRHHILK